MVEDADSSVDDGEMLSVIGSVDEAVCDVSVEIVWIDDVVWSISVVDDAVLSIVEEATKEIDNDASVIGVEEEVNSVDSAVNIFSFWAHAPATDMRAALFTFKQNGDFEFSS